MPLTLALLALLSTPAFASSEDAWEAFRAQVGETCLALAGPDSEVEVNPFGSESYGAAIVTTTTAAGTDRAVCVFDKKTGAAELTAPFTPE